MNTNRLNVTTAKYLDVEGIFTFFSGVKEAEREELIRGIAEGSIIKVTTERKLFFFDGGKKFSLTPAANANYLLCMNMKGTACVLQKKMPNGVFLKELELWGLNSANRNPKENHLLLLDLVKRTVEITDQQLASFCAHLGIRGNGGWFMVDGQPSQLLADIYQYRPEFVYWMSSDFKEYRRPDASASSAASAPVASQEPLASAPSAASSPVASQEPLASAPSAASSPVASQEPLASAPSAASAPVSSSGVQAFEVNEHGPIVLNLPMDLSKVSEEIRMIFSNIREEKALIYKFREALNNPQTVSNKELIDLFILAGLPSYVAEEPFLSEGKEGVPLTLGQDIGYVSRQINARKTLITEWKIAETKHRVAEARHRVMAAEWEAIINRVSTPKLTPAGRIDLFCPTKEDFIELKARLEAFPPEVQPLVQQQIGALSPEDRAIFYEFLARSEKFNRAVGFPSSGVPVRVENYLKNKDFLELHPNFVAEMVSMQKSAHTLLNEKTKHLLIDFIAYMKQWGTEEELAVYKKINTPEDLVHRLIECRPLVFFNSNDTYLVLTQEVDVNGTATLKTERSSEGFGDYANVIPKSSLASLEHLINYNEMSMSALLSVVTKTPFINTGGRVNRGIPDFTECQKEGVYMGTVGARYESPGKMEHRYSVINNTCTPERGFGVKAPDQRICL